AFARELAQRLPHRRARDLERCGNILFAQPIARLEATGANALAQLRVHLLAERVSRDRLHLYTRYRMQSDLRRARAREKLDPGRIGVLIWVACSGCCPRSECRTPMTVRSAERVLDLLEIMARHSEAVSLAQLLRTVNLPKSSTLMLARTLQQRGYVTRDS